jgi:hypothetical protein
MKKYLVFAIVALCVTITGVILAQPPSRNIVMQVEAANLSNGPASVTYLRKHIGDWPSSLFNTQPLERRMRALLGPEYSRFIQNMGTSSPLAEDHGILYTSGNAPHQGGMEGAVLLIDDRQNRIEAIILHDGKSVRAWAEGNRAIIIPPAAQTILQNWPQDALARAVGKLSPKNSR